MRISQGVVLIFICAALGLSTACTHKSRTADTDATASDTVVAELPLPDVPKSITDPMKRAEYVLQRFWDPMNFADTVLSHNEKFLEQNFVNFISLFPHADPQVLPAAIGKLLQGCKGDRQTLDIVTDLAEKYLGDAGSPMRSEDYYIIFLEELLATPGLVDEEQLLRPRMQLQRVLKNRPGDTATDFHFLTREGQHVALSSLRAELLVLIFYDPDCGHCTEILEGLAASEIINALIGEGVLSVLAVYTEGNRKLWNETCKDMPLQWTVAIDESHIVDKALYDLPAMPTIYLLSTDKTVLLKDPTPEMLEGCLLQMVAYTDDIE